MPAEFLHAFTKGETVTVTRTRDNGRTFTTETHVVAKVTPMSVTLESGLRFGAPWRTDSASALDKCDDYAGVYLRKLDDTRNGGPK